MTPSWRQLAAIPHSVIKDATLRALGVEVPAEGVAKVWHDRGLRIEYHPNPQGVEWWTVYDGRHPDEAMRASPRMCRTAAEVAKAVRWVSGTPTGDAIRRWLSHWGYAPPGAAPATDTTKTII